MPSPFRPTGWRVRAASLATVLLAAAMGACGGGGEEAPEVTVAPATVTAIGEGLCAARADVAAGDPAPAYGAFLRVHTSIHNLIAAALAAGAEDEGEALNDAKLAAEDALGGFGGDLTTVLDELDAAVRAAAKAVDEKPPPSCPA